MRPFTGVWFNDQQGKSCGGDVELEHRGKSASQTQAAKVYTCKPTMAPSCEVERTDERRWKPDEGHDWRCRNAALRSRAYRTASTACRLCRVSSTAAAGRCRRPNGYGSGVLIQCRKVPDWRVRLPSFGLLENSKQRLQLVASCGQ